MILRQPDNNNTMRYLYYRKTDRKVILMFLCLITTIFSLLHFFGNKLEKQTAGTSGTDSTEIRMASAKTSGAAHYTAKKPGYASEATFYDAGSHPVELFCFDPNTADSTELLRLGLQPWQVRNIYKYRSRGGIYRRTEDFARLYGLTAGQYRRMKPYIRISPEFLPAALLPEAALSKTDTTARQRKIGAGEHIVLNTADSTQLLSVPGIGHYFTRRILTYGKQLGGYVSVDQLDEIEDFPTESKQYFIISSPAVRRLNLNRLSVMELRRHPYISFHQAQAIADYRRIHGQLSSLQDMKTQRDFPPEAIERLLPYVEF